MAAAFAFLLRRPVRRLVVAFGGELAGLGAVGEHGPDLARAGAGRFEDDMAAVGSPAGALVARAGVWREIDDVLRSGLHDVEIVVAVGTAPTEGKDLPIGRPGGIDDVAFVRKIEQVHVGTVGVHHVELGDAAAVADEDDALTGFGVPGGRGAAAGGEGEALGFAAVDVGDVKLG